MYTCEIDCAYNTEICEFFEILVKFEKPNILKYIPIGPAGGNPAITLLFNDRENIINFLKYWYEESKNDETFINSLITTL
jgi:hypothetical protein